MTPEQRPQTVFFVLALCIVIVIWAGLGYRYRYCYRYRGLGWAERHLRPEAGITALGWAGLSLSWAGLG